MKKTFITVAVAISLLTTSIGVYAASNTNSNPSTKPQVESKTTELSEIAKDPTNSQGRIEYSKVATLRDDGSEGLVFESWTNPKTFDSRMDNIMKRDGKVEAYNSTYTKDSGRTIVMLQRDENGKAISGEFEAVNQKGADYNNSLFNKYNSFTALRATYASSEWTADGTVKSEDGKTLNKVYRTYKSIPTKNAGKLSKAELLAQPKVTIKEVAYIDAATGLPTKIEKYEEANGTMDLINTNVYEFKYVTSPENLFDTNGVNLKQLPDFNYDENAEG
ncbi:hypothetical protein [Clostridium sp. BSD9I1]|uniref:hypothetical protein n=1 Tax=Clostridium sp. BSD9I1 TaxID=2003589 RepID=UPI001648EFAF|nr:hypothetical protein [Clostridium sp. BSD9I1]